MKPNEDWKAYVRPSFASYSRASPRGNSLWSIAALSQRESSAIPRNAAPLNEGKIELFQLIRLNWRERTERNSHRPATHSVPPSTSFLSTSLGRPRGRNIAQTLSRGCSPRSILARESLVLPTVLRTHIPIYVRVPRLFDFSTFRVGRSLSSSTARSAESLDFRERGTEARIITAAGEWFWFSSNEEKKFILQL